MTLVRTSLLFSLFLALAFALPATAAADGPDLTGTYSYDGDSSDNMVEAFEPAINEMSRLRRGFARRRVANQPDPPAQIRIQQSDDEIVIRSGDNPTLTAPLDGRTVDYVNADGETEKVSARIDGNAVRIHRDFEDGEYLVRYSLANDGQRLVIATEIDMDALPLKVDYRRIYNRD